MEKVGLDAAFWRGRRVLLTGHTGFKGSWLVAMLRALGARVQGFALAPPTSPSLFDALALSDACEDVRGDVRDPAALAAAFAAAAPELVIHFAAQPLVRASYADPVETWATNVMGTVHLLDACRRAPSVRAVIVATTDKVYADRAMPRGFREDDRLGGHDPYASSKAAAELAVASWRDSYFGDGPAVVSVRAGNVIGGGDFAGDRLVPDAFRAFAAGETLFIRHPEAVRPWQHVLDPLTGYLLLAERLGEEQALAGAWNFGPYGGSEASVGEVADQMARLWGEGARWAKVEGPQPHETSALRLDSAKAREALGWRPRLALADALAQSVAWYKAFKDGADMDLLTREQVRTHLGIG